MIDRSLLEADLDEYVEGESWPAEGEDGEAVPVTDAIEAQRILRRLKRLGHEAAAITDVAAADIERIEKWRDDRLAGIGTQVTWASRSLEAFARVVIPGSGRKSLPLPDGTLKLTGPGKGKVVVTDLPAFLAWAFDMAEGEATEENPNPLPIAIGDITDPVLIAAITAGVLEAIDALLQEHLAEAAAGLVRITVEPAKSAIAKLTPVGFEPVKDAEQGEMQRASVALPSGEMVPGIALEKAINDKFDYTLGKD